MYIFRVWWQEQLHDCSVWEIICLDESLYIHDASFLALCLSVWQSGSSITTPQVDPSTSSSSSSSTSTTTTAKAEEKKLLSKDSILSLYASSSVGSQPQSQQQPAPGQGNTHALIQPAVIINPLLIKSKQLGQLTQTHIFNSSRVTQVCRSF